MRLQHARHVQRRAMADINVVPYIDVMLVLLVIFMVTAPLVSPSIINLPTVGNAAPQEQTPPVVVNIKADGNMNVSYKDDGGAQQQQNMTEADLKTFIAEPAGVASRPARRDCRRQDREI